MTPDQTIRDDAYGTQIALAIHRANSSNFGTSLTEGDRRNQSIRRSNRAAPGSPGSWTSLSAVNTLTESFLSAGASGVAVAQGTHTGIITGEFGGDEITDIAMPPAPGVVVLPDWVSCNIGSGFSNGCDPHTVTAYMSPNNGHAYAVLANGGASTLAVVDLTMMLDPLIVPRTSGSGLGHACTGRPLPPSVVRFVSVP